MKNILKQIIFFISRINVFNITNLYLYTFKNNNFTLLQEQYASTKPLITHIVLEFAGRGGENLSLRDLKKI